MEEDLYAVLGVLPDAEDVVIRAAYRALAQRYHPDRWNQEPSVAHEMMARLNRAYSVLGDQVARADYDRTRSTGPQGCFDTRPDDEKAFEAATSEQRDRWVLACSIFPDLEDRRKYLARISSALSFYYVATLLELKVFKERAAVAKHLEETFLQRYFGTNGTVLAFAKELILEGARDAARRLNSLVDVLGSEVEPELLLKHIQAEFPNIRPVRELEKRAERNASLRSLMQSVLKTGHYADAMVLSKALGYPAEEQAGGFLSEDRVNVKGPDGQVLQFANKWAYIDWVRKTLCLTTGEP